jgi:hypothetical protein
MGQAPPEVIAAATEVTGTVLDDGLVTALAGLPATASDGFTAAVG